MHLAGIPLGALIAIITFGVFCALLGVACLVAALRQHTTTTTQVVTVATPQETLTDSFGVIIYRAFNRVLISPVGGGILIALLRAKSRA